MDTVLIVVDALRYDRCGFTGYERNTTPFLDEFAENNKVFHRAYAPSTHTRESVAGILTGDLPIKAVNDKYELRSRSVVEDLRDQGYNTGGFHSNVFLSKAYGYSAGFDEFYDSLNFSGTKTGALGQKFIQKTQGNAYTRADDINEMALKWWNDTDQPRFMWIQYMDVHGPYEPKEEFRHWVDQERDQEAEQELYEKMANGDASEVTEEDEQFASDLYDCEIRYMDQKIRELVQSLPEDTNIIITSDHGEAFGEDGYYDHPRKLDKRLMHVPLLVSGEPEEINEVVSLRQIPEIIQGNDIKKGEAKVQVRDEDTGRTRQKVVE